MTLRRSIVDDVNGWLGLHRGLGGEHRARGSRRRRNPWLSYVGPALAALVTAASMWLLLSGFGRPPHGRIPQVLPQIVATQLLQSGPAGRASEQPRPTGAPRPTGSSSMGSPSSGTETTAAAGSPAAFPSSTPSPSATAAAGAPPPLPPPAELPPPPVTTSTPPACPPPVPPTKSKGPKGPEPTRSRGHW